MTMASSVVELTARRILEHAREHDLTTVRVILHGGEPLLAGRAYLADAVSLLREVSNRLCESRSACRPMESC